MEFEFDGSPVGGDARKPFLERFVHGSLYESRPDVQSVIHTHSRSVIPFSVTPTKLRPIVHSCATIGHEIPVWDAQAVFGDTSLLIGNVEMGRQRQLRKKRAFAVGWTSIVRHVSRTESANMEPGSRITAPVRETWRTDNELGVTWEDTGVETLEDALTTEVATASTGAGSPSAYVPELLNNIVGTQYNIIQGYAGVSAARLALESGEVDAMVVGLASLRSTNPEWLEEGRVNVIWQLANAPHPDYPDVPAIGELGETPDEQAVFRLVAGSADVGRSLVTAPNVPEERVEILRAAFDSMISDPEFLADAQVRNLEVDPISGAALQEVINGQMQISDAAVETARQFVMAE